MRTSSNFTKGWEDFITRSVGVPTASPIFYQHVTDIVFNVLVKIQFSCDTAQQDSPATAISDMEESTLRYVAGYVLRQLKRTVEKSSNPLKESILFCLAEMADDAESNEKSADWIHDIDRGGLCHVTDSTYSCFYLVEEIIRQHLQITRISDIDSKEKERMIQEITSSDEVLSQWREALGVSTDSADTLELLKMVTALYITIRGFAFTKSCLELYKQASKKTLAKSKGIRKQLFTPNVKDD